MNKQFGIGEAVKNMRLGHAVARLGWNGNGMKLFFQKAYPDGIPINKNTSEATGLPEGTVCRFLPYLMLQTVDGSFVPWLASQTDILAEDWSVISKPDCSVSVLRRSCAHSSRQARGY